MIVLTRCMLAFSALAIIWIDPSEPARLVELTYGSLAIYCIYSAALALISSRADWPAPKRALHWVDILFYAYLVGLTEGTSSIFFYFFSSRFWSPRLRGDSAKVSPSPSPRSHCSLRSD